MASPALSVRSPNFLYDLFLLFWRAVIGIFFREIRPRGAFNIPRDGPVILVAAPHHNQFLDPLLLMSEVYKETRRRVEFLTAAKSMKRKAIGFFASAMAAIPVSRAADEVKAGTGNIRLSDDDDCLVIGVGTKFTTELKPKWQIMLPKNLSSATAEVIEIISDTQLRVKKEFGSDSGKVTTKFRNTIAESKESGENGLPFRRLPFIDQQEMYHFVYKRLKEGGLLGIFPEGGSHDRTDLLPLKAGVAIMALGAMANDPKVKVKIVPVGLSYFHAHRFRSRAVVEFGTAMDVPHELVSMFKEGGPSKREACSKLLDLVYEGLKTVTLRAPDYDTLMLIQAARRLYETPGQHLTLGQVVELNKRFLQAYEHFKDEPRVQNLKTGVLKYNRAIRDLGLRDHQVPRAKPASWKTFSLFIYRFGLLIVWTVFSLPGVILNGPIFIAASVMSRKKAKEALAASNVKIAGKDVLATWKVLISLGIGPILYLFYAFLATSLAIKAQVPLSWILWTPVLTLIALPIMSYAALKFGEAGMDVLKSLRPLVIALLPGQQRRLDKIKGTRESLSNELTEVINELGPKLWDDFDHWRIMVPSSSAPPSTGKPGLWRRKSGNGAVDAQGNLLVHPMTWLDERLFGWSRSSPRGTSAWAGNASSDPSRTASPVTVTEDESDDEGDYEQLLGYVPIEGDWSPPRSRSRSLRSSYADLQQLKMTPAATTSTNSRFLTTALPNDQDPTLHHRERRDTLQDDIPVEKIGNIHPDATFKDATATLNKDCH